MMHLEEGAYAKQVNKDENQNYFQKMEPSLSKVSLSSHLSHQARNFDDH